MSNARKHTFLPLALLVVLAVCNAATACSVTVTIVGDSVAKGTTNNAVRLDISVSGTSEGKIKVKPSHSGANTGRITIWNSGKTAKLSENEGEFEINVAGTQFPVQIWVQGVATSSAVPDVTVTVTLKHGEVTKDTKSDTVTVVEVDDEVQYQSGANWIDIIGPLYVLQGTEVTFKVVPIPATASWPTAPPSNKPVWGGTAGATGTGSTKAVTFNTLGDKTVTAECGNTVPVNVKLKEIVVEFSKNEVRPGSSGAARAETVTATAKRAGGGAAVTINLSSSNARATVSPASFQILVGQNQGQATVIVTGTQESGADRDTTLLAKVGADTKGSIPVTVTRPTHYWIRPSKTSGPWTIKPGTNNTVIWSVSCDIIVKDKWWKPLGPAWENAHVQEKVKNPGDPDWVNLNLIGLDKNLLPQNWSPLGANGLVCDVTRGEGQFSPQDAAAIVAGTKKFPKDWSPPFENPIASAFQLKFFVDEIELTGITNRTRTIQDNKDTVTNQH